MTSEAARAARAATPGAPAGGGSRSRARTITETDVVLFAAMTGDSHPLHVDATWAERSGFGERIAHGALVLSYAIGLVDLDVERTIALRGISRVTFKAPVRIGDTIRVETSAGSPRPLDASSALVETACRVLNQEERAVARFTLEIVERRDAGRVGHGD